MKGRTTACSLWQLSKCWLFLWLRTHVGLLFRAIEHLPDGAKPSVAGIFQLAHSFCSDSPSIPHCLVPLKVLCLSPPTGWLVGEG